MALAGKTRLAANHEPDGLDGFVWILASFALVFVRNPTILRNLREIAGMQFFLRALLHVGAVAS